MDAYSELEESQSCLRALVEHSFDGVFIHHNFIVLESNAQMDKMLGLKPGELLGKNIADFLTEHSLQEVKRFITEQNTSIHQVDFVVNNGGILHTDAYGVGCNYRGQPARIVAIRDKTGQIYDQHKIRGALADTAAALANAVESADPYTSGHMSRVAHFSVEVGREMGLSSSDLEGLHLGATLHDVGKIAIPIMILNKPGRLTDVEMALVRTHAERGARIIKDIDFPWPIYEMVLQHHERLDGSGYPEGLSKGDICLEARIIAVADVLESMSSHRPYRPALPVTMAIEELLDGKGKRYDADVVDVCLDLIERQVFRGVDLEPEKESAPPPLNSN